MAWFKHLPMMVVVSVLAVASPVPPQPRSSFLIGTSLIADAIVSRGVQVSASQVELLADVVSAKSSPSLDVMSLERWGERRSKVMLTCHEAGVCLPFYVALNWSDEASAKLGLSQWAGSLPLARKLRASQAPPVVRAGQPLILFIESGRLRMQLPVVSLENGPAGGNIRVATRDRKRIYNAQIVNGSTVKGGI